MTARPGAEIALALVEVSAVSATIWAGSRIPIAYADGYTQGLADSPGPISPAIAIVSPASPSGFPADLATAQQTPIVIDLNNNAGTFPLFASVVARYPNENVERVVFRRGSFRRGFTTRSYFEQIGNVLRLHCLPDGGWPESGDPNDIVFDIDGVSGAVSAIGASS